jgi:hypothetical protein
VTVSEIYLYVEHCLGDGAVGATAEATITWLSWLWGPTKMWLRLHTMLIGMIKYSNIPQGIANFFFKYAFSSAV